MAPRSETIPKFKKVNVQNKNIGIDRHGVSNIRYSDFEFVSDFGFGALDFSTEHRLTITGCDVVSDRLHRLEL